MIPSRKNHHQRTQTMVLSWQARMIMSLVLGSLLVVFIVACDRRDPGPTPTIPPTEVTPANTEGFLTMNLTGTLQNGVALNHFVSMRQFYGNDDVSITFDSLTRPAAHIITIFRLDTISGSRMQLQFRVFNWRDTTAAPLGRSAQLQFYHPRQDSASIRLIGSVPNNALSDLSMRVARLQITGRDSIVDRVRGEYALSPIAGGGTGTLVTGSFDVSMLKKGYLLW